MEHLFKPLKTVLKVAMFGGIIAAGYSGYTIYTADGDEDRAAVGGAAVGDDVPGLIEN